MLRGRLQAGAGIRAGTHVPSAFGLQAVPLIMAFPGPASPFFLSHCGMQLHPFPTSLSPGSEGACLSSKLVLSKVLSVPVVVASLEDSPMDHMGESRPQYKPKVIC